MIYDRNGHAPSARTRRWTFIVLINAAILIVLFSRIPTGDTNTSLSKNEIRWQEQIEKIHNNSARKVDVIFLGSSSMYEAIDEDLFRNLTHKSNLRLALFGDFGIYGDYQLLKRWLKHSQNIPEAIIIWHTYDVWPRVLKQREITIVNENSYELPVFYWNRIINNIFSRTSLHFPVVWTASLLKSTLHNNIDIYRHKAFVRTVLSKLIPISDFQFPDLNDVTTQKMQRENYWHDINTNLSHLNFSPSYDNTYWLSRIIKLAESVGSIVWISHSPMNDKVLEKTEIVLSLSRYNKALAQYINSFPSGSVKMLNSNHIFYNNFSGDIYHVNARAREHVTRTVADQYNNNLELLNDQ